MIKKAFLLIAVLLFIFVSFLLFRTFTFKSRQLSVKQQPFLSLNDSCIVRLQKAITYQTISFDDSSRLDSAAFSGFHRFLSESFPNTFSKLHLEKINKYSLLFHWKGKTAGNPIVLMAHQDVVPVEEATLQKWDVAPFSGLQKNGFIYGRGAIDDKGSLMAILESVEILIGKGYQPASDIYLAFGHDEEAKGRNGAGAIAALFKKRNIRPAMVLDEGGIVTSTKIPGLTKPTALIGISEKGYITIDLQLTIPGGHSSMPEKQTAIDEMARAVVKLKDNPFPPEMGYALNSFMDHIGPEMPFVNKMAMANRNIFKPLIFNIYSKSAAGSAIIRTTTATTIFNAGEKENVVPGQANATVNFRTQPGTAPTDVIAYVTKIIDNPNIKITPRDGGSSPKQIADVNHATFQYLHKTLKGFDNKLIVSPYLVLGATDGRYFGNLTTQVFRFIPFTDPEGFHGINERIGVADYKKGINFYYQFILGYKP